MGSVVLTTKLKVAVPVVTGKKGVEMFPLGVQGSAKVDEKTL